MTADKKAKKEHKSKPYELMELPGQRIQLDVKVIPRLCITNSDLCHYQYTTIDEYSRLRILGAYSAQSTFSSADFLHKVVAAFARKSVRVEYVQTDNSFELTNRLTLFEETAAQLRIHHKLIQPYTPRHNGKVERSHREDQKRFYDSHSFLSIDDFAK